MTFHSGFEYNQPLMGDVLYRQQPTVLSRLPQQWHRQSPSRIISGRIEKPRSTNGSPAYNNRRRAWTGTMDSLLSFTPSGSLVNLNDKSHLLPGLQQRTMQRPMSWHIQTQHMPSTTMSPSFALMRYQTPNHQQIVPQSLQLPHMNQLFDSPPELYVSNGLSATSPASSIYSMDCGSNPSPTFQLSTYHHSPAILDSTPMTSHMGEYKWIPAYSHTTEIIQKETELFNNTTNLNGNSVLQGLDEQEITDEDDGEVLIALGLYDTPESSHMSLLSAGKPLKLAESWQPPPEEETEDEEEEENEEEEKEQLVNLAESTTTTVTTVQTSSTSISLPKIEDNNLENIHPWPNTVNQATTSGKWWY